MPKSIKPLFVVVALLMVLVSAQQASAFSVNELLPYMREYEKNVNPAHFGKTQKIYDTGFYEGYITGVVDTHSSKVRIPVIPAT